VVWECALKGRTKLDHPAMLDALADWIRSDVPRLVMRGRDYSAEET
jgi:DNA mismatch endonuclease (patch repair protein)